MPISFTKYAIVDTKSKFLFLCGSTRGLLIVDLPSMLALEEEIVVTQKRYYY